MGGPLEGIRVLDLASITAGHRATGILADYGADVILVEPGDGSPDRFARPEEFAVFNRGKRSVSLGADLGTAQLMALVRSADVLVESAGRVARADAYLTDLDSLNPGLVRCRISGFGDDDQEHRDLPPQEALAHAVVGTMAEQLGHRDGPIFEGLPFASAGAAYLAAIGILAALYRRSIDGVGRRVDTSLVDGILVHMAMYWGEAEREEASSMSSAVRSTGNDSGKRIVSGAFRCSDGHYLGIGTSAVGAFGRLMKALDLDEEIPPTETGRELSIPLPPNQKAFLDRELRTRLAQQTSEHWERLLEGADVCAIPMMPPTEVFDSPQVVWNGMVIEVDDPQLGETQQVGPPIKFTLSKGPVLHGAPLLGQHTTEVLGDLETPRLHPFSGTDQQTDVPILDGLKVLDLGAFLAGPLASRLLADLGATVVKVEPPAGDPLRGVGKMFRAAQAGKQSVAVDLKDPDLRPLVQRLVAWADVVHHNMRPGVAERLGVTHEDLKTFHPDIVYGYSPGWGSSGPCAHRQSLEPHMSGFVGAGHEVAGRYNDPLYPISNSDIGNGLLGAVGLLMGLLYRIRTGDGQALENPHLNAAMMQVAHIVRRKDGAILGSGRLDPLQMGFSASERLYLTSDGWICIAISNDKQFVALGEAIGRDLAGDPRFHWNSYRKDNDDALIEILSVAIGDHPTEWWLSRFRHFGVPAAEPRPYNSGDFLRDPRNRINGRVAEVTHPELGRIRELSKFVRVGGSPVPPHRLAPDLGSETEDVLRWAGYGSDQIAHLVQRGAVRLAKPGRPQPHAVASASDEE